MHSESTTLKVYINMHHIEYYILIVNMRYFYINELVTDLVNFLIAVMTHSCNSSTWKSEAGG